MGLAWGAPSWSVGELGLGGRSQGPLKTLEPVSCRARWLVKEVDLHGVPDTSEAQTSWGNLRDFRGLTAQLPHQIVSDDAAQEFLLNHFVALGSDVLNPQRDLPVSNVVFHVVTTCIKLSRSFTGNLERRCQVQRLAVLYLDFMQFNFQARVGWQVRIGAAVLRRGSPGEKVARPLIGPFHQLGLATQRLEASLRQAKQNVVTGPDHRVGDTKNPAHRDLAYQA